LGAPEELNIVLLKNVECGVVRIRVSDFSVEEKLI